MVKSAKQHIDPDEAAFRKLNGSFRKLLASEEGKEVLWFILGLCELYSDPGDGMEQVYRHLGKQAVGHELLSQLEQVDRTAYARLILHFAKRDVD